MKRSEILIPLSQDHHHGLKLAMLISKDAPEYNNLPNDLEGKVLYAINAWEKELSIHFKNEEKKLFPAVKGRSDEIDNLINELLEEHKSIEQLVYSLKENNSKEETLDELSRALKSHIRKEERDLFDKIQIEFSEDELKNLVEKIEPVKND